MHVQLLKINYHEIKNYLLYERQTHPIKFFNNTQTQHTRKHWTPMMLNARGWGYTRRKEVEGDPNYQRLSDLATKKLQEENWSSSEDRQHLGRPREIKYIAA